MWLSGSNECFVGKKYCFNDAHKQYNTPLLLTVYEGKIQILCYIAEIGATINIFKDKEESVLHLAAVWDSAVLFTFLVDKVMSVNLINTGKLFPCILHVEMAN
jgi:ankyrin repeat protein